MNRCLRNGRVCLNRNTWVRWNSSSSLPKPSNTISEHIRDAYGDVGLHQDLALVSLSNKCLSSRDTLSHDSFTLLKTSTNAFLPPDQNQTSYSQYWLHLGYQQVYFRPHLEPLSLLSDGTDSRFLPGDASVWKYRLWAGGSVAFDAKGPLSTFVPTIGEQTETVEQIRITGQTTPEKVFVTVKKEISHLPFPADGSVPNPVKVQDNNKLMVETYTLCFLRNPLSHLTEKRKIRPPSEAMFAHTMIPNSSLLFQFSAMTNNAHKIHYDASFAKYQYGLSDLVVHGPLTQVLLAEFLRISLSSFHKSRGYETVVPTAMRYSNIEPLYVDEEMTLCCKPTGLRKNQNPWEALSWRVWIQKGSGKNAALAVKAEIDVNHLHHPEAS